MAYSSYLLSHISIDQSLLKLRTTIWYLVLSFSVIILYNKFHIDVE